MTTSPDAIGWGEYQPLAFNEAFDDGFDWDTVVTCHDCQHCFQLTDVQCKRINSRMNPYGRWHKNEREVFNAMRHALRCFGVCEVRGELVDLSDVPCDHLEAVDDER